ncbi:YdaU family protein [Bartonella sp. B41]
MKHTNQQKIPYYESSTLPYVCWYQDDFLGGVRGMRAHEIGIYTILLNEMYARGRPLGLSVERLARICGCDKRTFTNVLEMLLREGKILKLSDGLWNKRCENVFQERAKLLEQKSFAGRSSAEKRKKINAEIQQKLNENTKDGVHNLESQKREEKETPNGVSEKVLFSSSIIKEERKQESLFAAITDPEQNVTTLLPPPTTDTVSTHNLTETNLSKKSKSRTSIPKGTRLPTDWTADIQAAISEGLSEEKARWQEKKFRDYWHAKSGKEALKTDWQATWRNWFRREIERIKENQERLAAFSSRSASYGNNDDALYKNLINYRTNEHEHNF